MRQRSGRRTITLFLLALPLLAAAAPDRPTKGDSRPEDVRRIELHVGIPGFVYIGQSVTDLVKKFPRASVVPFAGQDDAAMVNIADAGISCIAVGAPKDLKLASVGFNLDGVHEGMTEGRFRTSKGIGKGSTVNDLLEAYGEPGEILAEKPRGALKRKVNLEDPAVPKMYQYASEDGSVKTFFLVEGHQVKRVVVNHLAPLDEHIVKGGKEDQKK